MTLEEAIKYCEKIAEEQESLAQKFEEWSEWEKDTITECKECASEHRQLAEWLRELKAYKEDKHSCELCEYEENAENQIPCADCKHNHRDYFECRE